MKNFEIYKEKILKIYNDINNIDVKEVFEKLRNIKLENFKKFNSKDIIFFIKNSKHTKSIVSFIFFIIIIFSVFIPSINFFSSKYKLSRQYLNESKNLPKLNDEFLKKKKKFKKISSAMKKINNSIINKEKLIFITNLFDDLSRSTSIRIDLLKPINEIQGSPICNISEINQLSKNINRTKTKLNSKNSNEAIYELKIYGDYLNIISFLNFIQNYDIMIIADCLQVEKENIQGLSDSGFVKANLIIKLPIK